MEFICLLTQPRWGNKDLRQDRLLASLLTATVCRSVSQVCHDPYYVQLLTLKSSKLMRYKNFIPLNSICQYVKDISFWSQPQVGAQETSAFSATSLFFISQYRKLQLSLNKTWFNVGANYPEISKDVTEFQK